MPAYQGSDGRWRYRFTKRGIRYSGSAPKGNNTKAVAKKLEAEHIGRTEDRSFAGKMPTVAEFAVQFLEHQKARTKPLTQRQQRITTNYHIVPAIGRFRLDAVDKQHVDHMITVWSRTLSAKSVNGRLGTFNRMMSLAKEWKMIRDRPKIEWLKVPKKHPRFLSEAEAAALLAAAEPAWRSMVLVGLRTGMRIGELRGLQWWDVDFDRGVVVVRRTDPGAPGYEPTVPKGGADRLIPLTPEALAALRDQETKRRDSDPTSWVWPGWHSRWASLKGAKRPRSEKGCVNAMRRMSAAAGLKGVTWHVLRHTYASWLVMRAVPLRVVQKYMGHATITQTERYAHLAPDYSHAAVALLDVPLATSQGAANEPRAVLNLPSGDVVLHGEFQTRSRSQPHSRKSSRKPSTRKRKAP